MGKIENIDAKIERLRGEALTASKASEVLKVSRNTLYRWEKNGTLIPYRRGGRVMYKVEDVVNFLIGG